MDEPIRSRPYSTEMACEKCCFGRGLHAAHCVLFHLGVDAAFPESDVTVEDNPIGSL